MQMGYIRKIFTIFIISILLFTVLLPISKASENVGFVPGSLECPEKVGEDEEFEVSITVKNYGDTEVSLFIKIYYEKMDAVYDDDPTEWNEFAGESEDFTLEPNEEKTLNIHCSIHDMENDGDNDLTTFLMKSEWNYPSLSRALDEKSVNIELKTWNEGTICFVTCFAFLGIIGSILLLDFYKKKKEEKKENEENNFPF